jgi:hypothetical protein
VQQTAVSLRWDAADGDTVVGVGTAAILFFEHNLGANRLVAIDVSADDGESWRTIAAAS